MSIFEGIGSLDNRARPREQLWIPPFAQTQYCISTVALRLSWWNLAVVGMIQELPCLVVTWSDGVEGQSGLVRRHSSSSILEKVASLSQGEVGRSLHERNCLGITRGLLGFSHRLGCLPAPQER
jgi:hypothetical protein